MGDQPGDGVDHDDLTSHLPHASHGYRRPAAPFSVVDSQQGGGVFYQKTIAVQHTIFVVSPADIDNRIRPLQNGTVKVPR